MLIPVLAIVLCHLSAKSMVGAAEPDRNTDFYKRLYDFGLGKRAAYSYVSEYKRLPVYNFGLGKRGGDSKMYAFGLGKRYDAMDDYDELKDDYNKRMKQYSFGLGKRLPSKTYSFGLGKRSDGKPNTLASSKHLMYPDYDAAYFAPSDDYEVKRSNSNGHKFAFGLGKRDMGEEMMAKGMEVPERSSRSMHYNFGLGKRRFDSEESDNQANN